MSAIKNVILIGATGNLGPSVLRALQANPNFTISILTRETSTTKDSPPAGVRVVTADYNSLSSLTEALAGQDAVVSTISSTVVQSQKIIIDAAINAGVERFIPAEFGSDTLGKGGELAVFSGRVALRKYLEEKAAEGKITYTAIANGAFLEWGLKVGFLGFNIAEKKATLYDGGSTRFSGTTLSSIGDAVAGVLAHPTETKNKYIFVQSTATTQLELLALYEKLTGSKWATEQVSTAALEKAANEKLAQGDYSTIHHLIYRACYAEGYGSEFTEDSNELLGVKRLDAEGLEEVLKGTL